MCSPVNTAKNFINTYFEEHLPVDTFAMRHGQKLLAIFTKYFLEKPLTGSSIRQLLRTQPSSGKFRSTPSGVFSEKGVLHICNKFYRRTPTPIPKCGFNKVSKQLYSNYTSTRVFFCKFAAYFQSTFFGDTSDN